VKDKITNQQAFLEHLKVSFRSHLVSKGFNIDDDNCEAVSIVSDFYARECIAKHRPQDIEGFTPPKGLIIHGNPGTGKTFLAAILAEAFRYNVFASSEIVHDWSLDGYLTIPHEYQSTVIVIDDFGTELGWSAFGVKSEYFIQQLMNYRWNAWDKRRVSTIITTNFPNNEIISEIYGENTKSRIVGMCRPVLLQGRDRREE